MLDFEAIIETGQQIIQQISFDLQHISSVLNTELFDPFEVCVYRGGNYWELASADEFSGDDEYSE
uniref:Non-structural protein 3b n=1 Tax=Infectious bronchitis virus TaxID=11120 RepID=A0A7D4W9Y5_9GAMC|nr:3b protein [Infectious bronchitis virus]